MALLLFSVLTLAACATPQEKAGDMASRRNWHPEVLRGGAFDLQAYLPARFQPSGPLVIYVEGDGMAWLNRFHLSPDPTPQTNMTGLQLALADQRPNVVYLARPCQYVSGANRRNCQPAYWDTAAYAPEVIASYVEVIDGLKRRAGVKEVIMVGYSGGAAVAALVAASRDDCAGLISVAGVLDHRAWTRADGVGELAYSLNPVDKAERLAAIPQIHYSGAKDRRVPTAQALSYAGYFPPGRRPRIEVIADQDHECCWAARWPALVSRSLPRPGEP